MNPPTDRHIRFTGLRKGKVEARQDPLGQGRLKVRVEGIHGKDVPVQHLPWALPKSPAYRGGGFWCIPPLGSGVWTEFEASGDHEYLVWSGGLWSEDDVEGLSQPVPMDWFGSEVPHDRGSPLKPDPTKSDPSLAPNVFHFTSPLKKALWLDDRKHRECLIMTDQKGSNLFLNSEVGGWTLEARAGIQGGNENLARGLTLLSDAPNDKRAWQFFSPDGWLVGQDDVAKSFYVQSPGGYVLSVSEERGKVEVQTPSGVRMTVDDAGAITASTPGGRFIEVSDVTSRTVLKDDGSYVVLTAEEVDVFSAGKLRLRAAQDVEIASGGKVSVDGMSGVYWQSAEAIDTTPADVALAEPSAIPVATKLPLAYQYSCYADPVKSGGSTATPTGS